MIILVNGESRDVSARDLDALVVELDLTADAVATALNQDFVPRTERAATALTEGDAVEILTPMEGG